MKRAGILLAVLVLLACSKERATAEKPVSVPGEKTYALKGKIVSRDVGDNTLNLDHEAIPGFMEAMKMDYALRGQAVAAVPPDGSRIEAKLHVIDDAYWVTDVRKAP